MNLNSDSVIESRQKRKKDLVEVHGGKCAICGYDKYVGALQFHHINPSIKDFQLSGNCRSLKRDLKESSKCILVCANCHAEIHGNVIIDNLISSYNPILAQEKLNAQQKQKYYCKNCGIEIPTRDAQYCRDCYDFLRRTTQRPDRETLKNLIRIISFEELGRQYHVSSNSIRKWCDKYNLPRRKTDINSYSDSEWESV